MTDTTDLVARLRSYAKDQGGWHNIDDTCEEAADTIERITRERDEARAEVAALTARVAKLEEGLAQARIWHESEDKALSKSGRSDIDYRWRRCGHADQIAGIRQVLPDEEYNATLDRINARAALEAQP
jgi:hypothetical protein